MSVLICFFIYFCCCFCFFFFFFKHSSFDSILFLFLAEYSYHGELNSTGMLKQVAIIKYTVARAFGAYLYFVASARLVTIYNAFYACVVRMPWT